MSTMSEILQGATEIDEAVPTAANVALPDAIAFVQRVYASGKCSVVGVGDKSAGSIKGLIRKGVKAASTEELPLSAKFKEVTSGLDAEGKAVVTAVKVWIVRGRVKKVATPTA